MRVALISDIHANEVALEAVLADIDSAGVDQTVCLGDVATLGPEPHAVLRRLRQLGCPCIMGNHDAFMLDPHLIHTYTEAQVVVEAVDWCRDRLTEDELEFIRGFQPGLEIELDRKSTLRLYHGTPRSHMEDLLATTPPDELERMLAGATGTVLAGGHTHMQMVRPYRGMLIANPGSVGLPFKEFVNGKAPTLMAHAEYAIVSAERGGVSVELRRVMPDLDAARRIAADSDNPLREMWLEQYA
jgi:predicted phosphodiesterase